MSVLSELQFRPFIYEPKERATGLVTEPIPRCCRASAENSQTMRTSHVTVGTQGTCKEAARYCSGVKFGLWWCLGPRLGEVDGGQSRPGAKHQQSIASRALKRPVSLPKQIVGSFRVWKPVALLVADEAANGRSTKCVGLQVSATRTLEPRAHSWITFGDTFIRGSTGLPLFLRGRILLGDDQSLVPTPVALVMEELPGRRGKRKPQHGQRVQPSASTVASMGLLDSPFIYSQLEEIPCRLVGKRKILEPDMQFCARGEDHAVLKNALSKNINFVAKEVIMRRAMSDGDSLSKWKE